MAPRTSVTISFPPVPGATLYSLALNGKTVSSSVNPTFKGLTVGSGANTVVITATVPVSPVTPPPTTPVCTTLPKLIGKALVGSVLSVVKGVWTT